MEFLSYLISGISLGSIYAIIALGYTMVYGIAKMLNFAHGDIIMIGGYVSFCSMYYLNLPPIVATLLAVIACTVLGIVIERLAYAPLRSAPSLSVELPCGLPARSVFSVFAISQPIPRMGWGRK